MQMEFVIYASAVWLAAQLPELSEEGQHPSLHFKVSRFGSKIESCRTANNTHDNTRAIRKEKYSISGFNWGSMTSFFVCFKLIANEFRSPRPKGRVTPCDEMKLEMRQLGMRKFDEPITARVGSVAPSNKIPPDTTLHRTKEDKQCHKDRIKGFMW